MTELLIKLFVKKDADHPEYRIRCGALAGFVGIFSNLLLFAIKLAAGILSGSISIMADALNNLSDMGSSVVTMLGFRLAARPADPDHPYGHGRYEYISAFIVSGLILIVGVELLMSSVDKIFNPTELSFSTLSVIILGISILVKLWMFLFNRRLGKKIDSDAVKATSSDSLNDAVMTLAILLSVLVNIFTGFVIDAYLGAVISLFIIWAGFKTAKETLDPLLGQPLDSESARDLEREIMSFDGFLGVHDLMTHNYGHGRSFASVHVEVPCDADIIKVHEQVDLCEKVVFEKTGVHLTIHMDPVETNNEKLNLAKSVIAEKIREIHPSLTIHDFRMTPKSDERTNLIFDVVVPADMSGKNSELKRQIEKIAKEIDPTYCCVIEFDIQFVK